MKTLKFKPHLAEQILTSEKTSTWRIFDDKNLQEGDELQLMNSETREVFAQACIESITSKKLGELTDGDWEGHEKFSSEEEMYKTYRVYYGDSVDSDTIVKIIKFILV
jgi:hypothetical protein